MKKAFEVEIRWTAFPLHPDIPEDGLLLKDLFSGRSFDIGRMMKRLTKVASAEGLPLGFREKTYNSRLAQELGKWAEAKHRGDAFHDAAFRAYFADGLNIGKISTLVDLAESVGLPGREAEKVLESRMFQSAVDSDWSRSSKMGVTAVPTFMLNRQALVGAQPYPVLERFLESHNIQRCTLP